MTIRQSWRSETALSSLPAVTPAGAHAWTTQVLPRLQLHSQQDFLQPVVHGLGLPVEDFGHPMPAAIQHLPVLHKGTGQDSSRNVSIKFRPYPIKPFYPFLTSFLLADLNFLHILLPRHLTSLQALPWGLRLPTLPFLV